MSHHNPPLILIADDQMATTVMLQRVFEYEGYEVITAFDGIAALQMARDTLPDLILLDINMPHMNGFEVLKALREHKATATIPTIVITAMGEWPEIVQGLELGADDYVRKPFHPRELLARAQSKIRARQLEEALQRRTRDLEALLRVSEALNQHLEMNELLELILFLLLDLLPGEISAIYKIDENGQLLQHRHMTAQRSTIRFELDHDTLVQYFMQHGVLTGWSSAQTSLIGPDCEYGLVAPLQYGDDGAINGIILIAGKTPYDDNQVQLLSGIARQANMALHNAELYEMKATYASDLEVMVAERTHELQSTQQLLVRAEKLASVGRLAASIAHEINNPLMPIKINLDIMLEDLEDGTPIEAVAITNTLESVERIKRVVERLLEFTGKSPVRKRRTMPIDVNRIVENVSALVRKSFEHKGQTIHVELGDVPAIYADKDGLEQVLMNLALNASEAMSKGGEMWMRTEQQDGSLILTVKDTGHGIPADIIDTIFEPFVTTKDDGNGLGLFVSYGIIQNHNGEIHVESEAGSGTAFRVTLPIHINVAKQ